MAPDRFAKNKERLTSAANDDDFMHEVAHLLNQGNASLTEFVRGFEAKIVSVALTPSPRPKARINAVRALATLQSRHVAALSALVTERSLALVAEAAIVLGGRVVAPRAVTRLLGRMNDAEDWVPTRDAIVALRYFDDARVVPTHLGALAHPATEVRVEALRGLAHLRAPEGVPHWVAAVKKLEVSSLSVAASALAECEQGEARKVLRNAALYARLLARAKTEVDRRRTVDALSYFELARVDADLVALVKAEPEHEVIEGAMRGLARRNSQRGFAQVAVWAFGKSKAVRLARPLVSLLLSLARSCEPERARLAPFIAAAERSKPEVLEELADETRHLRYALASVSDVEAARLAQWRTALGRAKKNKKRLLVLLDVPEDASTRTVWLKPR